MCIVIDTNVLSCVFSGNSAHHHEYIPVLKWITAGPGCAVYGGSTYLKELRTANKYHGFMLELRRRGKAKMIETGAVDAEMMILVNQLPNACDDVHLIALFRASGCRLLCSNDQRADAYIKNRQFYCQGQRPPKIYRCKKHSHLLRPCNVVPLRNVS